MRGKNFPTTRYDQAPSNQKVMPTQSAGISLIDLGLEQFGRFRSPKTIANAI